MKNVYFKPLKTMEPISASKVARELLKDMASNEQITFKGKVPIKVHFGEAGNTTFIPADSYNGIIDELTAHGAEPAFIETNVLYRGQRTTRDNHIKVAKEHGFTKAPIIIADGEAGEATYEVEINQKYFDKVSLGKAFENYNQIVVCSHFKGHASAGFGGAIKQLSMGFASRSGKMAQHAKLKPTVDDEKCVSCGICIDNCDVDAIDMKQTAQICQDTCIGCAMCIAICPVGAIANDWASENFKEKITEYAYGAQKDKSFVYINFLMNITELCDCAGKSMQPIAENIGVLASTDPVAIDKACYDLLQKSHGSTLFESGVVQFKHAEAIGFGDLEYNLIEI